MSPVKDTGGLSLDSMEKCQYKITSTVGINFLCVDCFRRAKGSDGC